MTPNQARTIYRNWLAKGKGACQHGMLMLEDTEHGFLTGSYFCMDCGAHLTGTGISYPSLSEDEKNEKNPRL